MDWDPEQYLTFAPERARPFRELLARVGVERPATVVDLGCGPGNLTLELAERWPGAQVLGLDSSQAMIERAHSDHQPGSGVRFEVADLREWAPDGPVDVIVSNAVLQWVPDHLPILDRLATLLRPGGWLAFQVPGNFAGATHTELAAVRGSARWQARLDGVATEQPAVEQPPTYLARLAAAGLRVDAWETTYLQVLQGRDAVLEWMRGTGLRPVLSALSADERAEFEAEYGQRLRQAYPEQAFGTVLPYRRIFMVAHRPAG